MAHAARQKICLVGGSAGSHVLAASLDRSRFQVSLLTRRPTAYTGEVVCRWGLGGKESRGKLHRVSNQPDEVVADADVVLLSMPVGSSAATLQTIAPHIHPGCVVGTLCGQGGFNFWARQYLPAGTRCFGLMYFPYVARVAEGGYGRAVRASTGRVFGGHFAVACDDDGGGEEISLLLEKLVGPRGEKCRRASWLEVLIAPSNQARRCAGLDFMCVGLGRTEGAPIRPRIPIHNKNDRGNW